MFRPNTTGLLMTQKGHNVYGEPDFAPPVEVRCGVVRLNRTAQKTTVRADSSGSRGASAEFVSDAKILFLPDVEIGIGDRFEIYGMKLRAVRIEPRIAVTGVHEHNEVDFEVWA